MAKIIDLKTRQAYETLANEIIEQTDAEKSISIIKELLSKSEEFIKDAKVANDQEDVWKAEAKMKDAYFLMGIVEKLHVDLVEKLKT